MSQLQFKMFTKIVWRSKLCKQIHIDAIENVLKLVINILILAKSVIKMPESKAITFQKSIIIGFWKPLKGLD